MIFVGHIYCPAHYFLLVESPKYWDQDEGTQWSKSDGEKNNPSDVQTRFHQIKLDALRLLLLLKDSYKKI